MNIKIFIVIHLREKIDLLKLENELRKGEQDDSY